MCLSLCWILVCPWGTIGFAIYQVKALCYSDLTDRVDREERAEEMNWPKFPSSENISGLMKSPVL